MQIIYGKNIFTMPQNQMEAITITTNGMTKKDGTAVMGAGIAKTASLRYPFLAKNLGRNLCKTGNHVYDMGLFDNFHIITFPTKNHWKNPSDIHLIEQSCQELVTIANQLSLNKIYCVPFGCGCGNLDWHTQVKPICDKYLDDRFIMILPKNI